MVYIYIPNLTANWIAQSCNYRPINTIATAARNTYTFKIILYYSATVGNMIWLAVYRRISYYLSYPIINPFTHTNNNIYDEPI